MAWDAVMKFWRRSEDGPWPKGESQYIEDGFSLTTDWRFSLENKLNITQHAEGAGSGKAQFEPFMVKKQIDTASPDLYRACGMGAKFHDVTVSLFKSMGNPILPKMNAFCIFTFNLLVVQKIEWSFEDEPQENITFLFGSCSISYGRQTDLGLIIPQGLEGWNQVSNTGSITEVILGNPARPHKVGLENLRLSKGGFLG